MEMSRFISTYTPAIMRMVKKYAQALELEIKKDLASENHHVVLESKRKIDDLAEAKMLLSQYEGCPHCMEPNCQSDHK